MSAEQNSGQELPEELKAIEAALRQLTPRGGQIDRDRLMYLAGRASVKDVDFSRGTIGLASQRTFVGRNLWPMATAALVLISLTLGGLLLRESRMGERIAYPPPGTVEASKVLAEATPSTNAEDGYFQLRHLVLTRGVDALPKSELLHSIGATSRSADRTLFQPLPGDDS